MTDHEGSLSRTSDSFIGPLSHVRYQVRCDKTICKRIGSMRLIQKNKIQILPGSGLWEYWNLKLPRL